MTLASITAWAKAHSISAHSIAATVTSVALLIVTDATVRNNILQLFATHPKIGTILIAAAGIWLKYSVALSPAGVVATAEVIKASPTAPTAAEVYAVKPGVKL
jgi:hypothetical protein